MDGVLVIDKPPGITSHDVVAKVRRIVGLRRIGHTGTLDPISTGVLPLVLGRATRLATFLSATNKTYDAVFHLGIATDTYDVTGRRIDLPQKHDLNRSEKELIDAQKLKIILSDFLGTFWQQPPPFSAKKIGGVRAYTLARRQAQVKIKATSVTLHSFDILSFQNKTLRCRLTCSTGFYVRSLAHDLGTRLGCGACLAALRRESSGGFNLDTAVTLEDLETENSSLANHLIPLAKLLPEFPTYVLTDRGVKRAAHGNEISLEDVTSIETPSTPNQTDALKAFSINHLKLLDREGDLVAIGKQTPEGLLHPTIVLV